MRSNPKYHYRHLHPDQTSYTYHNKFRKSYSRIDRLYISEQLLAELQQAGVTQCFYTDHHLVWGYLDFDKHDRGPGLWSLNNSILKDRTYTKLIKDFWEEWKAVKTNIKTYYFRGIWVKRKLKT